MSNCNTYNQRQIYTSILQVFSKTLAAEVYIEIHMLKKRVCMCEASRDCRRQYIGK